jgi:hypothetical protein
MRRYRSLASGDESKPRKRNGSAKSGHWAAKGAFRRAFPRQQRSFVEIAKEVLRGGMEKQGLCATNRHKSLGAAIFFQPI